jgi:mono/diheme cytochrome c family protein
MRMFALAVAVGMAVAVLAGCGGRDSPQRGRAVFVSSCADCHTLTGRDNGRDNGDLANPRLSVADLESFAKVMPIHPKLSQADALAVAQYVHSVSSSIAGKRP